jgi:hypothetical protein
LIGASITGADAWSVLLVAMRFTLAVIVIRKQWYLMFLYIRFSFVFILKIFVFLLFSDLGLCYFHQY